MEGSQPGTVAQSPSESGSTGALRWKTRRGSRELDLILQRYLERRYPTADAAGRRAFERLLEESDADLLDWIFTRRACPPEYADVIRALAARS